MLKFTRIPIVLSIVLMMLSPIMVLAGPPEPPGFSMDQESMAAYVRQYESIRQSIVTMVESHDKRALLLLLDGAGAKFFYAKTATELTKAWAMLGRLAALVAEAQRYAAAGIKSTPKGVLLAAPLYFGCEMTMYPSLRGYVLTCPATRYTKMQKYWCQGLRCQRYWQIQ